jgi:hypothetical protein
MQLSLIVTFFLVDFCLVATTHAHASDGPSLGFVHDGYAYSVQVTRGKRKPGDAFLLRQSLDGKKRGHSAPSKFRINTLVWSSSPRLYRWRISNGCYWDTASGVTHQQSFAKRVPLSDLVLFDIQDEQGARRLWQAFYPNNPLGVSPHDLSLDPVVRAGIKFLADRDLPVAGLGPIPKVPDRYFDFLPTGPKSLSVFVLEEKRLSVWAGTAEQSKKDPSWETQWGRAANETIESQFCEPFVVYGRNPSYFFVTISGKVFLSAKPASGQRKMVAMAESEKLVVQAILTDTAANKIFLFAERAIPPRVPEAFWFELKEKIVLERYDGKPFAQFKNAPPGGIVFDLAKFLISKDAIKQTP